MTTPKTPFTKSEYDRRLVLARAAMADKGLDLIVVTDPSNQAWLTGYDGWSFYVHQGVVLTQDADPIWWGRMQDTAGAKRTVWMTHDDIIGYPDHFVQSTSCHPMEHLAELINKLGHGKARIGVEMDNYYYSAKAHVTLVQELPKATVDDATALVNWCRSIKSDEELTFMRRAARISEKMMTLAIERAAPGVLKNELVGDIQQAATYGADDHWGDYPAIVPLTPSGDDAAAPHLTWDGSPMKTGEATFFELSGCYRRYHAPLCRTVFLGKPPETMVNASNALTAGLEAGLEAAVAGNCTCDIANALHAELKKAGIERSNRCGYPIGISYPPDWGERTMSLRDIDTTELEPGMTFHFMPGLWMDDWGLETTETILIKDSGPAEPLCSFKREMIVKL